MGARACVPSPLVLYYRSHPPPATHPTASTLMFSTTDLGHWALENGLAVYRDIHGKTVRYDQPSLELAIENVKNNRSSYATYEAYQRHWFHFERGLALFKGATGHPAPPECSIKILKVML